MKVTFLGQMHYFNCSIPSKLHGFDVIRMNYDRSADIDFASHETDVWILFRPDFLLTAEQLRAMRGKKIWVSTEPVERTGVLRLYRQLISVFRGFDLITHYDRTHLAKLRQTGIVAEEFQLPVNLEMYHPWKGVDKEFDFFFSGRSTPHREELMKTLKRRYRVLHAAHGLIDHYYTKFVSRSWICLNLNVETYPQLQHRMQNMLACGAFVMSERQSHHDALMPDVHYTLFRDRVALEARADYYLQHPDEMEAIALRGMEYTKQHFNAELCWLALINKVIQKHSHDGA